MRLCVGYSVTSFVDFSPLLITVLIFWPFIKFYFSIWQNFELILAIFYAIGQILIAVNGQIWDKQSSHMVTMVDSFAKQRCTRKLNLCLCVKLGVILPCNIKQNRADSH